MSRIGNFCAAAMVLQFLSAENLVGEKRTTDTEIHKDIRVAVEAIPW